jgi:general stress protein YciG
MQSSGTGTRNRGFASMNQEKQREIARKGGRAAHEKGTAHEVTPDEARAAGRKGGERVSSNREHMSRIGRMGGKSSAHRRSLNAGSRRSASPAGAGAGAEANHGGNGSLSQAESMPAAAAAPAAAIESVAPPPPPMPPFTINRGEHANRGETGEVNKGGGEESPLTRHHHAPPPGSAPGHRAESQPAAHGGNGERAQQEQVEHSTPT